MYTYKHAFKLKPLIPYIVFFLLFIWIFTYYSLTVYYDIITEHQAYISSGKLLMINVEFILVYLSGELCSSIPDVKSYLKTESSTIIHVIQPNKTTNKIRDFLIVINAPNLSYMNELHREDIYFRTNIN